MSSARNTVVAGLNLQNCHHTAGRCHYLLSDQPDARLFQCAWRFRANPRSCHISRPKERDSLRLIVVSSLTFSSSGSSTGMCAPFGAESCMSTGVNILWRFRTHPDQN